MEPNIGIANRLIRITMGLTMLTWSTAKLSFRSDRESYLVIAMLGAMKVGEGITAYCPVTDLIEKCTKLNDVNLDSIAKASNPIDPNE